MDATASSDVAFLRQVIDETRHRLALDATPLILFGSAVVAGVVGELVLLEWRLPLRSLWLWAIVIGVAWCATALLWRRRRRRLGAQTLADRQLGGLWTGCWSTMCVVGFGGALTGQLTGAAITGTLAAMLGAGFFATSVLVDSPPIRWLALGWWVTSVAVYLLPNAAGMALFGAAMLLLQVVPAWLLQRKWRATAAHV